MGLIKLGDQNRFIVIEGLDGAGKSTQIKLLKNYFNKNEIKYKYLHFPRSGEGYYGDLIAKFLRGEFGSLDSVDPYLVALIYAGDRDDAKKKITGWLENKYFVIVDRYVYSNIAFQCAKLDDESKKNELEHWILEFEYFYNKIPKPDLSIYLHVPFSFVETELKKVRVGKDRVYLNGKSDIHEASINLQKNVEQEYLRVVNKYNDFKMINCLDTNGSILSSDAIHNKMMLLVKNKIMLK
ncbi:dTMP kinase [Desulfobacula phenolica]|uniref:Thymidylate kinase n=1 Tax=Desulfobacula phenolica TaxID=90732 RepID=A0A1H2DVQ9_9BACT|nr:dTMP kinase [Desulfobacula phenolica]SDT86518.1 dTMP kinase [Desulfobacula phenolica]